MAFISAPNTGHFRLFQRLHNQRIENGFYFQADAPLGPPGLTSILTDLMDEWEAKVLPFLSKNISLVGGRAMSLESDTAPAVELSKATPVAGGLNGDALPGNCAFVIKFSSEARGRKSRGRIYVAGLVESSVAGNRLDETAAVDITTGVREALIAVELAAGVDQVVVSRTTDPATTFRVTQRGYSDLNIDSQRRRLTGRGL